MSEFKHKSIAFVINSLEGGGAERVVSDLSRIMQGIFDSNQYKIYFVSCVNYQHE